LAQPLTVGAGDAGAEEPVDVRRPAASGAERRRHPRTVMEGDEDRRQGERREGDRRSMSDLRSGLSWVAERDKGGRRAAPLRMKMKASRIVVLVIAAAAGTVAAVLALTMNQPAPTPIVAESEPAPTARVLVANKPIAIGEKLTAASVGWQPWPQDALNADYITADNDPAAIEDVDGSVVRSEFLPGDPIRREKLADTSGSYLPALLEGGMRGVSVSILAESASGGFIAPNDHVDVVLTRNVPGVDGAMVPRTDTILRNVRVLAIDAQLSGERSESDKTRSEAFSGQALATLALNENDAEVIISATLLGKLSLLLRASADTTAAAEKDNAANQAIRFSSPFWAN